MRFLSLGNDNPMEKRQTRRIDRELTPDEEKQLKLDQERIAQELPDLIERNQMYRDARSELTLSGELRRAVHASELSLARIAAEAGTTPLQLDEFLTGEATLPSDAIDRLAALLGYELSRAK